MSAIQNEPYQRLINCIQDTELKLKKDSPILDEKIDINSPDWQQIAMHKMEVFWKRNKPDILDCANLLVQDFPLIDDKKIRSTILQEICRTTILKNYLTLSAACNTEAGFSNTVILFILTDMGVDSRDWILALHDCSKEAFQNKIKVKKVLASLSFLANDTDHHGFGSAKDIIGDLIRKYE